MASIRASQGKRGTAMSEQMREIKDTFFSRSADRFTDLTFYSCGMQNFRSGMNYGPIVRGYYVIHFVTKGRGTLYIRNQKLPVAAGQAFLLPANIPHEYRADPADPWQYCWLSFLGEKAAVWFRMLQQACGGSFVTPQLQVGWFAESIREMIDLYQPDWTGYFECTAMTASILGRLFGELNVSSERESSDDRMMEIRYFIEMNVGKKLKVKEIADEFGYHPNYLTRSFARQFGISPKQYILRVKMLKADKMLQDSHDSISLIALSLGFPDETSFSRAYRKFFGWPPSSRRQVENRGPHALPPGS